MSVKLYRHEIGDPYIRENFAKLMTYLKMNSLLAGFKHLEITFEAAEANRKVPHGLRIAPRDILQTSLTGAGVVTWNYDLFDAKFINVSATGPCTVRAFCGTYSEG